MLNLCLAYFLNNCRYLNEFDLTQLKLEVLLGKKLLEKERFLINKP